MIFDFKFLKLSFDITLGLFRVFRFPRARFFRSFIQVDFLRLFECFSNTVNKCAYISTVIDFKLYTWVIIFLELAILDTARYSPDLWCTFKKKILPGHPTSWHLSPLNPGSQLQTSGWAQWPCVPQDSLQIGLQYPFLLFW